MKKVSAFLIIVLLLGLTISASADSFAEYYIEEGGMSIEVPTDYYILTRKTAEGDPALVHFGLDLSEVQSIFEEGNTYFDALEENASDEITVSIYPSEEENLIDDYKDMSDYELKEIAKYITSDVEVNGITIEGYSIYKQNQTKFIVIDFTKTDEDGEDHNRNYQTYVNGTEISIEMTSYTGALSDEQKTMIKHVVDSATFDSISAGASDESLNTSGESSVQGSSNSNLMMIFYVLIGVAVLVLLVYLFLRKSSKKNQSNFSGDIYNHPFENEPVTGTYPQSVPLSENRPTLESIPVHEDLEENRVTNVDIKPAEYILCPNCSERLKSDAVFCPFCGARISEPNFEADDYEPTIRAD